MKRKPTYQALKEQFEDYLIKLVLIETLGYPMLQEMIFYHFGWQPPRKKTGKRLRPMLTMLSAEMFSEDVSKTFPAAAAMEILHNFTLIHDDIEDNSDLRHGNESLWKKYGIAHAINTGDYLSSLALISLSHAVTDRPELLLATFLESAIAVTKGQHEDIRFESLSLISDQTYLDMIGQKTASLFKTSMKLGALCSGSSESVSELLGEVGYQFGIAYQMYDDYLGIWGDPIITGKPAGIDLIEKKKSFPVLLGIQKDPHFASRLTSAEPIDSDCISSLIQTLHDLGVRNQAREKISQHLDEANKQLNDLRSTNDLDMQRLGNYVNSLFKIY